MSDIVTNVLYQDIDRLQEKVKELEAERDKYLEELIVAKNVIKSDESQIKNLIKRNEEMRDDCIKTAADRDRLEAENERLSLYPVWKSVQEKADLTAKIEQLEAELAKARAMLEKKEADHEST